MFLVFSNSFADRCVSPMGDFTHGVHASCYYYYYYYYSTRISRCDFSQKCAENKGIQVRTKRDKCVSATKNKKVRTNDNNNNHKQEGDKTHLGTSGNNVATLHNRTLFEQF